MNTKTVIAGSLSTLFFEFGLALKLNKIPINEAIKCMDVDKVKNLVEKAEQNNKSTWDWDGTYITPGERLKAILEVNEISQAELAKKLGEALDTNYKMLI
jgi:hypothetical protein